MKQEKILELLKEAAGVDCSIQRRVEIQGELGAACKRVMKGQHPVEGRGAGMMLLLDGLYSETMNHRPDIFPLLFPFFAMICGDSRILMIADVDWSLYPQNKDKLE